MATSKDSYNKKIKRYKLEDDKALSFGRKRKP